jgi:hypothetical protein
VESLRSKKLESCCFNLPLVFLRSFFGKLGHDWQIIVKIGRR